MRRVAARSEASSAPPGAGIATEPAETLPAVLRRELPVASAECIAEVLGACRAGASLDAAFAASPRGDDPDELRLCVHALAVASGARESRDRLLGRLARRLAARRAARRRLRQLRWRGLAWLAGVTFLVAALVVASWRLPTAAPLPGQGGALRGIVRVLLLAFATRGLWLAGRALIGMQERD